MSAVQQSGQPINDKEQLGQQTLSRRASYPCENYEVGKKGLGKRSMGDRQDTVGTSMVVDGSFVSSLSSDHSVEESSFRQLQGAVKQVHGYFFPSSSCVYASGSCNTLPPAMVLYSSDSYFCDMICTSFDVSSFLS
jgi:hypothetical protein